MRNYFGQPKGVPEVVRFIRGILRLEKIISVVLTNTKITVSWNTGRFVVQFDNSGREIDRFVIIVGEDEYYTSDLWMSADLAIDCEKLLSKECQLYRTAKADMLKNIASGMGIEMYGNCAVVRVPLTEDSEPEANLTIELVREKCTEQFLKQLLAIIPDGMVATICESGEIPSCKFANHPLSIQLWDKKWYDEHVEPKQIDTNPLIIECPKGGEAQMANTEVYDDGDEITLDWDGYIEEFDLPPRRKEEYFLVRKKNDDGTTNVVVKLPKPPENVEYYIGEPVPDTGGTDRVCVINVFRRPIETKQPLRGKEWAVSQKPGTAIVHAGLSWRWIQDGKFLIINCRQTDTPCIWDGEKWLLWNHMLDNVSDKDR